MWDTKFAQHFDTWPALGTEPQTFWSWLQQPTHLVTCSYTFCTTLLKSIVLFLTKNGFMHQASFDVHMACSDGLIALASLPVMWLCSGQSCDLVPLGHPTFFLDKPFHSVAHAVAFLITCLSRCMPCDFYFMASDFSRSKQMGVSTEVKAKEESLVGWSTNSVQFSFLNIHAFGTTALYFLPYGQSLWLQL